MSKEVSGLAASIRSSLESETFDLAGANTTTIANTIRDAFAEEFSGLPKMIRLTFIVGAGKLGRARYDENAAKTVTTTLRELGYVEDRGASAVEECSGSFKLQHDTGKNLKTVVVFPKLQSKNDEAENLGKKTRPLLDEGSIEHKLAFASSSVFEKMVASRCPSWSELKGCVAALNAIKDRAIALDMKLVQGQALGDAEQEFYDSVSVSSLEAKISFTRDLMLSIVDAEKITENEKQQILLQVEERVESLEHDIKEAEKEKNTKKQKTLEATLDKAKARKLKVQAIKPSEPLPLKNEAQIAKLRKELTPLLEIETAAKGRLMTLKESQALGRKDEILEEIKALEISSKGWFESDEAFQARVKASERAWQLLVKSQTKKKVPVAKSGTASKPTSSGTATKWVTPGARPTGAWGNKPIKAAAPGKTGGLFAAMMDDSDSD